VTSRERVLAALRRQEPDRVPTFEWILNPDVIEKMTGSRSEIKFVKQMDLDGIAVGTNLKHEQIDDKHYREEWGIVRVSYDEYPTPVEHPVQTEKDLKNLTVPDPDADYRFDDIKKAMKLLGDEKAVIIRLRDVFSQPRDLMGFSLLLESFYTQPDLVRQLMDISVNYNTRLAKNAKELGGEIIVIGDDYATNDGPLMSPKMFREVVLPPLRKLVENFKQFGFYVIKHTDGNIMPIIDDLIDTGIDCLDPIDPLAHMDIGYIKETYGQRVCIKGNVDCVSTLVDKNPEDVVRETKQCIAKASVGGGHIISSSNSIHAGISPVNYKLFLDTVKEYGKYPLEMDKLNT